MEKKNYIQAPLPFMGQKRRWNKDFKSILKSNFADCGIFVDLFGGSGLLSHFTRSARPDAVVVYNDYDDYSRRLGAIPATNALLAEIRGIMAGYPDNKRIEEPRRGLILAKVEEYGKRGFVDYITLSASLLFSGKYATCLEELMKHTFYNTVRTSDYSADGYLDGLIVVHEDYRTVFNEWKDTDGVCYLIDPPYLQTQCCTYANYWQLGDYLDVLHTLNGTSYVYFTSNKSSVIELCDWIGREYGHGSPFDGSTRMELNSHLNYNAGYTDIMLYKHKSL